MEKFDYKEFINRNIGFVTEEQQHQIQSSKIFVCGVGGMGGACVNSLARMGIEDITIADIDDFELSNINRQVFANTDTLGKSKVFSTQEQLLKLNPNINITSYEKDWPDSLDRICDKNKIIINGTDDILATLLIYRKAKMHGCTVIDAYASPLPSVYVVKPDDPRPEETLNFPTIGKSLDEITSDDIDVCVFKEIEFVMTHSSSVKYIDIEIAAEYMAGKRSRMSIAPMVIATGNMMAYEVLFAILNKPSGADNKGYFWNPYKGKIEKPRNPLLAFFIKALVRRFLNKLLKDI